MSEYVYVYLGMYGVSGVCVYMVCVLFYVCQRLNTTKMNPHKLKHYYTFTMFKSSLT